MPAGGEEVEPDVEIAFGAVRDAADEPLGTLAPTTWDETRALEAKAGEYVIVAKRGRQDAEEGFFHRISKKKWVRIGPTNLMRITSLCKSALTPGPGPPSRWRL